MLFDADDDFDPYDDGNAEAIPNILEGLKPPHQSNFMIGHESVEEELLSLINSQKMPHALIFSGQRGIGKSTMAQRLSRALLAYGVDDPNQDALFGDDTRELLTSLEIDRSNPIFSKVASQGHADMLTIEKSIDPKTKKVKKDINVESARKVAPFLRMTSADGGWRIVVIDNADTMNRNAQNAILKILEEPPKNALLILVCHRLGAMIPTIRSRCRVIDFEPLTTKNFETLLNKEYGSNFSAEEKKILNVFSNKSIGQAKDIIDNNGLENIQSTLDIFRELPNSSNLEIHTLSESAGRYGQDKPYDMVEKTFLNALEEIISSKARSRDLETPFDLKGLETLKNNHDLEDLLTLHSDLKEMFSQGRYANLDKRMVIINVFNRLKS